MSTGLYYAPQSYAKTEEVIELAKIAAAKGGVYDTHMRSESTAGIGLLGSIKETIQIGRDARIPVHISHIKALGPDSWNQSKQAIDLIKKARSQGISASACQYPYTASGTSLQASLIPRWAEVGGRAELLKRIDDQTWEADARVYLDELNRQVGLSIPEDQGFDTLGGFISTTLGRIPAVGTLFEHQNVKYTILAAEPQKVNRVRIEMAPVPAESAPTSEPVA